MKVTREKTEGCQAFLNVELEPAEMEQARTKAFHHLAEAVRVPGFRKGKAPRNILERYLSKETVTEEVLEHLLPDAYEQAIKEQGITAIARPSIEVVQTEPAVTFKAVVPLTPQVEAGDYKGIMAVQEEAKVNEGDVDSVLTELRHQQAIWEPVERPVALNDMVVLDIESTLADKPFLNRKGVQYAVVAGSTAPVPGFAEQLVGMPKGEEKEFKLSVPEDYRRKEMAGKEASFRVKVTEIKEEKLPELDDDFAKRVNPEAETIGALREKVNTELQQRAEARVHGDFEDKIVAAAVERAKVEFPPILVEAEISRLLEDQVRRMQMDAPAFAQYLKTVKKTEEQLREELRPAATKRVTSSLVLGKIAEDEKIEAGDAEIDAEIAKMTEGVKAEDKDKLGQLLNHEDSRDSLRQMLLTRKTLERLAEIAKSNAKDTDGKKKDKEAKK